jgi:hypothetical protein
MVAESRIVLDFSGASAKSDMRPHPHTNIYNYTYNIEYLLCTVLKFIR